MIPAWIRREFAIFGGMLVESGKFIFVSFFIFLTVFGTINGPAVWNNVRWWWYVNYSKDRTGAYWGLKFPEVGEKAEPDHTLFIPKIGVQAPIRYAESNEPKMIDDLLQTGVVHYPQTALPGEIGNVFITGHSSYYWWSKGQYNTIFSILDKLVVGDTAYIHYQGRRYTYRVSEILTVSPKDTWVLNQGDTSELSLMTCTPVGTNYKRLIIKFKQVMPDPKENKSMRSGSLLPG